MKETQLLMAAEKQTHPFTTLQGDLDFDPPGPKVFHLLTLDVSWPSSGACHQSHKPKKHRRTILPQIRELPPAASPSLLLGSSRVDVGSLDGFKSLRLGLVGLQTSCYRICPSPTTPRSGSAEVGVIPVSEAVQVSILVHSEPC